MALDPPELELQAVLSQLVWVLENRLWSSGRVEYNLNHWTICPSLSTVIWSWNFCASIWLDDRFHTFIFMYFSISLNCVILIWLWYVILFKQCMVSGIIEIFFSYVFTKKYGFFVMPMYSLSFSCPIQPHGPAASYKIILQGLNINCKLYNLWQASC